MEFQKNDPVTVRIEDIGNDGEGIGRVEGFTLFIKNAVPGDVVEAKIMKSKKNYAYARLEKILESSPFRTQPKCAFYRQCGGCQIQALSYEKQLEFKHNKIRNNLIRIGGFTPEETDSVMEPIVGMEEPFHYRNKAQYPVGYDREGNLITGFYAGRTHTIIANTECMLGSEKNRVILEIILNHMKEKKVSPYDETSGKGLVRHVLIRTGFTSGEVMVCIVINQKSRRTRTTDTEEKAKTDGTEYIPGQQALIERLAAVAGMTSISVSINSERTNVIMGREIHTIWGSPTIRDTIHVRDMSKKGYPYTGDELTFSISPLSFYQVNPIQTEKLYSLALEYAGLTGKETVWDLYCGIGTISLFLARKARQVYGVEIVEQAILDARQNAERNHIRNATFYVGKAEEILPKFYAGETAEFEGEGLSSREMLHPDVIVVDPPRKGCDAECLQTMLKMQPGKIVYVSCDSATLARDLRILCDGGYRLERVRGVDQFGQTVHVETVCLLSQRKPDTTIEVDLDISELEVSSAETKATYEEIKSYVLKKFGLKVSNLYIAQVKRECGIVERINYNLPKTEGNRVPQCPEDKRKAIKDAFIHFQMI